MRADRVGGGGYERTAAARPPHCSLIRRVSTRSNFWSDTRDRAALELNLRRLLAPLSARSAGENLLAQFLIDDVDRSVDIRIGHAELM